MLMHEEPKNELLEKLLSLQKQIRNLWEWKQLEAIWLREKLGASGRETAEALNYKVQTVHYLWHQWKRDGLIMFEERCSPGGRNHAYLSIEEEREFLEAFRQEALSGGVLIVSDIKKAYEFKVGHTVVLSTIYRMLHRHGWRKVTPRKKHPKTDRGLQEEVKKNS